jgi:hypothetical protein
MYKRAGAFARITIAINQHNSLQQHLLNSSSLYFNMQLSTLLVILAPAIVTVQATCYKSGDTWAPDQVQANNDLNGICNDISGNFNAGQVKYACRNAGSANKKLEFWIKNKGAGSGSTSHDECVLRLSNEINGCRQGGDSDIGSFNYRYVLRFPLELMMRIEDLS